MCIRDRVVYHASRHVFFTMPLQQWRHAQQAQLTHQWQLACAQRQPGHMTVALPTAPRRHTRQPPIIAAAARSFRLMMTCANVTVILTEIKANSKLFINETSSKKFYRLPTTLYTRCFIKRPLFVFFIIHSNYDNLHKIFTSCSRRNNNSKYFNKIWLVIKYSLLVVT